MSIIIHLENPFEGLQKWKENTFTSWIIKVVTLRYNLNIETSIPISVCKHCKCIICVSKEGHKLICQCKLNGFYINFEKQTFNFETNVKWLRCWFKQLVISYSFEWFTVRNWYSNDICFVWCMYCVYKISVTF